MREYGSGVVMAGQLARHFGRHLRQVRGIEQQLLRAAVRFLENFAGEIVEHQLRRRKILRSAWPLAGAGLFQQQDQACRPALRLVVEVSEHLGRGFSVAFPGDRVGFLARQPQVVPSDDLDRAVCAQPCHRSRRVAAADDDHAAARWYFRQRIAHHQVKRRLHRHFLVTVEHQRKGRSEPLVKCLEITTGERRKPGEILGCQQRQSVRRALLMLGGGEPEIVVEGRDVGVAFVDLVPQRTQLATLDIACDQRRLARARWTGHPDHRPLAPAVEHLEQAIARQDAGQSGPRGLAERDGFHVLIARKTEPHSNSRGAH